MDWHGIDVVIDIVGTNVATYSIQVEIAKVYAKIEANIGAIDIEIFNRTYYYRYCDRSWWINSC